MVAGWQEVITTDSVLISHFLSEGNMSPEMLGNETLLLVIGAGMGILVNLHLHSREADFVKLADGVDEQIKGIFRRMAVWLPEQDREKFESSCFPKLEESFRQAKLCAAANYNNSFFRKDTYQLDYIRMREQQTVVLKGIYENIKWIAYLPSQAMAVAELFADVEQLPQSREEFEARAILFYILVQMEELLLIKRRFIESGRGL